MILDQIIKLNVVIENIGSPTVLALTATATKDVLRDIAESLNLENVTQHVYSIDRPNIAMEVQFVETIEEKKEGAFGTGDVFTRGCILFKQSMDRTFNGIFKRKRRYWCRFLSWMEHEERMLIQQQFMNDQLQLVICTSAFGMGVNKSNTRYIIHFHYPTNIASYLQEIGRAGRDGEPSIAILLCSPLDHDLPISIIEDELPSQSQIQFLFSLLQERMFQTKELPIEEVEEICYNAARFNEQYWRFIRYHLEKLGIIQQRKLILESLSDEIMTRLIAEVEIRLRNKYSELENMKSWIQVKECRREYLLRQFGYRKEGELRIAATIVILQNRL